MIDEIRKLFIIRVGSLGNIIYIAAQMHVSDGGVEFENVVKFVSPNSTDTPEQAWIDHFKSGNYFISLYLHDSMPFFYETKEIRI